MSPAFRYAVQRLICTTNTALYALVDGLQYERYFGEELVYQQQIIIPLFDTFPDSRIAFAGPWIICMNNAMSIREKLEALECALPSVSWIISGLPTKELVLHIQKNMNAILPDGRGALLRLQDPRVQSRLGVMLDSIQHSALTGVMHEWLSMADGNVWSLKQKEFIC